ncbi:hypothetical protein [Paracoccus xiamenensis]|uniref:hypothetical protein n=1 Tax=Paracoccus xiamenensis TaxID=2714901 RepID=UPI0014077B32|nr:hypothetical protein [Paracoccus xiamenensis]NHF74672.1 hypothetical protein [Paracoccus xiamenensis]
MWAAIITAIASVTISAGTFYFTKQAERKAIWRSKKLAYYEEFFAAASGIVGEQPSPEAKMRFASIVNNLHLIGSPQVIMALHSFTDEIAESNKQNMTKDQHDRLWSLLVWHIRDDLDDPPGKVAHEFQARMWASGTGKNA